MPGANGEDDRARRAQTLLQPIGIDRDAQFVAFFVTIRYHTLYAAPWIYPPLAFYGLDLTMRLA